MISLYFYAFIVLCIVAGSAVGLYYISDSYIKLDKEIENKTQIKVCPKGVSRPDCLRYEDVILSEEPEPMPTTMPIPTFPTGLENKRISDLRDKIENENEYIMKLNERIDKINEKI